MKNLIIKILLGILALIVIFYGLDKLISMTPGYLLIAINHTTIEMNLWFALLASIALGVAAVYGWRLVRLAWRFLLVLMGRRSPETATRMTARGLLAYLRGEHDKAERWLMRSAKQSPMPLVNLLAAADSAHALGNLDKALAYFERSKPEMGEQTVTLALAKAEILRRSDDQPARLAVLQEAYQHHSGDILLRERLCEAYLTLGRWEEARALLPSLRKRLPRERWLELQAQLVVADITNLGQSLQVEPNQATDKLHQFWLNLSREVQKHPVVLLAYARCMQSVGNSRAAESLIRKYLQHHWHQDLVLYYGLLRLDAETRHLTSAESWLPAHGDDWALHLTLGRICLSNHLWGKAREYFEKSISLRPTAEAYAELARLLLHLGEQQQSLQVYQNALQAGRPALPELPLP